MRLHLLGVRGSTPAPGAAFIRYGGHTSCVALAADGEAPRLALDAGTGLRNLPALLDGGPFHGTLLLGHLHWDHTHGLPFCPAIDRDDAMVRLLLPEQGAPAIEVLGRAMSPPHFPIDPSGLHGQWRFDGLAPGHHRLEGFDVLAREIPHTGGTTFGFRVSDGSSAIAYLSDHGPSALGAGPDGWGPYHDAARDLARDVDVLVHDAQHTAEELPAFAHFGHSAAEYAVALGEHSGARTVVLYHHDPRRTDDELDEIVARFSSAAVVVIGAREGAELVVSGDQPPA